MANYFTRFSCVLPLDSARNLDRAYTAFAHYEAALEQEGEMPDFCITHAQGTESSELLITSGEGSGDPDKVAAFVGMVGTMCGLHGPWGFVWCYTCDRNRTDGFGGGALIMDLADGHIVEALSCDTWLVRRLAAITARSGAGGTETVIH